MYGGEEGGRLNHAEHEKSNIDLKISIDEMYAVTLQEEHNKYDRNYE